MICQNTIFVSEPSSNFDIAKTISGRRKPGTFQNQRRQLVFFLAFLMVWQFIKFLSQTLYLIRACFFVVIHDQILSCSRLWSLHRIFNRDFFFFPVSEEIPSKFILAQLLYYARCPVSIIYFAQSKGTLDWAVLVAENMIIF